MSTPPAAKPPEEVTVSVKLPKALHIKMTGIAASEGKTLAQKVVQAVREHAAGYERTAKTVAVPKTTVTYTKRKKGYS